jgi:glycosyltransferase involved in cell wall biosynthesis
MRILYISYFFPPLGGPAVLRNLKIVKYLCRRGAEIDLITVKDIEYFYYDESLLSEIPGLRVFRTSSLDPMALLRKIRGSKPEGSGELYKNTPERLKLLIRRLYPLDDKIGWLPFLLRQAKKLISQQSYDLIFVSCGPFSSALGALLLSRSSGIPYVYDARDYWTLLSDYTLQGWWQRKLARLCETRVLEHCSLFVAATQGIRRDSIEHFGKDLESRSLTIYNGWDEEDFAGLESAVPEAGSFELAYFGSIYARRSLKHFYQAMRALQDEGLLPEGARIKLYGSYTRETLDEISSSGIEELITVVPSLPHREALAAMLQADVLLLLINSSSPRGTLTSKLFEYHRSGKPILAMVPSAYEAADLLRNWGQNYICAMESSASIYQSLKRLIAERGCRTAYPIQTAFSRQAQIELLYNQLASLSGKA